MANTRGKRHVPPSRIKYEQSHPTVSFRIDRGLHEELKSLKKQAGLSVADVLRVGLDRCSPMAGEAYHLGWMSSLEALYADVCSECEDLVMALVPESVTEAPFP